ncbi:MAG: ribbon-helix-helix domain-containing protein [Treponema sp.]|nr:ribbon-helix-helix domain-containing protein [Treponema sp.]
MRTSNIYSSNNFAGNNFALNEKITTVRLPAETRNRLIALSKIKNKTKSEIIKESLEMYCDREENEIDSYSMGLPYFGKYGSGKGDLSETYKQRLKEKLRDRQNSY